MIDYKNDPTAKANMGGAQNNPKNCNNQNNKKNENNKNNQNNKKD